MEINAAPAQTHIPQTQDIGPDEYKALVKEGYNQIAPNYLEWARESSCPRIPWVEKLLALLKPGSTVLELGCGAGVPGTRMLAESHSVTANDISEAQISLAKENFPDVKFLIGDMMSLTFGPSSFDAAVALYSIIHIPRAEQETLIKRISAWLRPGGYFLLSLGTEDNPGAVESDWLGGRMYWSGFPAEVYRKIIRDAGFEDVDVQITDQEEDGRLVRFLWMLVRKP